MRRLAAVVIVLALGHAAVAAGAQTLDAGVPLAGPVLVAGGVAWADATARTPRLQVSTGGGPPRALVTLARSSDDGFYSSGSTLSDLSSAGGRIAYLTSSFDTAASKGGGPSLVASSAAAVAI